VAQAHAAGLRVLLVPHLWVETGRWRGELEPGSDEAWAAFAKSYEAFLFHWAEVARDTGVEMLAVGVELRTWVTTTRAPSFLRIIRAVRRIYPGLVTYAGNWDDAVDTVIWGELDVIGINAFYPLAEKEGADLATLLSGGRAIVERVEPLAKSWGKPVIFTEFGYTTRENPAVRPWNGPSIWSRRSSVSKRRPMPTAH
jgi:hypothetical protein